MGSQAHLDSTLNILFYFFTNLTNINNTNNNVICPINFTIYSPQIVFENKF